MIETISPLGADNRFIPDQVNEDNVSLWVKVGQVGLQTSHRTGGFLALTQTYSVDGTKLGTLSHGPCGI